MNAYYCIIYMNSIITHEQHCPFFSQKICLSTIRQKSQFTRFFVAVSPQPPAPPCPNANVEVVHLQVVVIVIRQNAAEGVQRHLRLQPGIHAPVPRPPHSTFSLPKACPSALAFPLQRNWLSKGNQVGIDLPGAVVNQLDVGAQKDASPTFSCVIRGAWR